MDVKRIGTASRAGATTKGLMGHAQHRTALTMLFFVFPAWGSGLLGVAVAVVASHLMLPFEKVSWRSKALLNTGAAIVVAAMIVGSWPERRPFALFRSNLSGQSILKEDVREARLRFANLTGARLSDAYLQLANLRGTDQTGANLIVADLQLRRPDRRRPERRQPARRQSARRQPARRRT